MTNKKTIFNETSLANKMPFTFGFASLASNISNDVESLDYNPKNQANNFSFRSNTNEIRKTSTILCGFGNDKQWDYDVPDRS